MAMKTALIWLPAAVVAEQGVPAVQKVIQMLGDMEFKSKDEKRAEAVAFAKFKTWCEQESAELTKDIVANGEAIERLDASICKLGSDIKTLAQEIGALQSEVESHEAESKSEIEQRAKDNAAFLAEEQDYSESVDALGRAISILKEQDYDRNHPVLLQLVNSNRLPEKARAILTAFLDIGTPTPQLGGETALGGFDYVAPEAHGYEFQSGGIVEMMTRLLDDFRGKLGERQKEEMNSKHAFNMIVVDLRDSIENKNRAIEEKTAEKARKSERRAEEQKELASTQELKASNEHTLKEMTTECTEKSLSFQEKQQLRSEEIEALGKAIEILDSPEALGNAEKHLSLAQVGPTKTSLAQLRGGEENTAELRGPRRRLRDFLEKEGDRLHSKQLTLLAEQVGTDQFGKVKGMIEAMITRLMEEGNVDAEHEGFCDTEMGKSKITRTKLSEEIDALSASIGQGKSTILTLAQEIARLEKETAYIDKSMAEAAALRSDEKAKNHETVNDSVGAQKAVAGALSVLKTFYEKASTATAFIQLSRKGDPRAFGIKSGIKMGTPEWDALSAADIGVEGIQGTVDTGHKEGMQTFGDDYQGQQDESSGVLALLEIIQSDFANLQADTEAAESEAADSFKRFSVESRKNNAVKQRKIEMNQADRSAAEAKLQQDTADLKATEDEMLAANRYHAKLVPQCIDQGMTFEEKTAARQAEIDSLKQALQLLQSPDIATSS